MLTGAVRSGGAVERSDFVYDSCMAFKTITVDLEAYELLRSRKLPGQSFSAVIKSGLRRGGTGRDLLAALAATPISEETLNLIDAGIAERQKNRARRVRL